MTVDRAISPRAYTWRNEGGFRPRAYLDSRGIWTVGVGCSGPDPFHSPDPIIGPHTVWTPEQGNLEFGRRHDKAMAGAAADLGNFAWGALCVVRQAALADMAYQMGAGNCHGDDNPLTGEGGLAAFHQALSHAAAQDWRAAHDAILASAYAHQTPARAQRNAGMMLTGQWPAEPW